jgi:hypothetical protein
MKRGKDRDRESTIYVISQLSTQQWRSSDLAGKKEEDSKLRTGKI